MVCLPILGEKILEKKSPKDRLEKSARRERPASSENAVIRLKTIAIKGDQGRSFSNITTGEGEVSQGKLFTTKASPPGKPFSAWKSANEAAIAPCNGGRGIL